LAEILPFSDGRDHTSSRHKQRYTPISNSFTTQPVWLDTDTSVGANTNSRGTSGCTLAGIGNHGIKPTRILVLPAATGTAIAAGTITISDPQSSTTLLLIPVVLPSASEPFEILQILLDQTPTLWRDFVVTGLSTATKAALQIWYRA
jgi:hypothetical protein